MDLAHLLRSVIWNISWMNILLIMHLLSLHIPISILILPIVLRLLILILILVMWFWLCFIPTAHSVLKTMVILLLMILELIHRIVLLLLL